MITDLYIFGDTVVHRLGPGKKLLALLVLCSLLFIFESWLALLPAALLVLAGFWLAGLSAHHAFAALRPVLWILAAIFLIQLFYSGVVGAGFVVMRFAVLILAASLVTLTTRTSEFVDGIMAGLRYAPRFVPREKIALAIAMTMRFIPRLRAQFDEIREAQRARGLERNPIALLVPLIVRTLKDADEIAQAIEARSVD
ncbi:energy-coupling factor transporter transmembrane component T family protein [Pseudohoeflea coraliihabitans]|uniref:Energy-coupling factor transporter transmembrane protein EcfT n=1 Tax=Pseudohoeflea coraliihabitans TaxID=2860393 RepID=A0ABS6WQK4_9HYPH|nr:energy-coupling factor transporter transmembrane protein EcfT [Pseudohoeflea sp. DP4N28-3]MBW3098252.1 energy-coupling factor transporter transmembrane protein EcfT [Pseudohoeflea sp. DP4N28-3]